MALSQRGRSPSPPRSTVLPMGPGGRRGPQATGSESEVSGPCPSQLGPQVLREKAAAASVCPGGVRSALCTATCVSPLCLEGDACSGQTSASARARPHRWGRQGWGTAPLTTTRLCAHMIRQRGAAPSPAPDRAALILFSCSAGLTSAITPRSSGLHQAMWLGDQVGGATQGEATRAAPVSLELWTLPSTVRYESCPHREDTLCCRARPCGQDRTGMGVLPPGDQARAPCSVSNPPPAACAQQVP